MVSDTRGRILQAARELFVQKGVQKTSLQDIAEVLGITKPALYYHFASREELLRAFVQPLIETGQRFLEEQERAERVDPRALLEGYFDFNYDHSRDIWVLLSEMSTLTELGLVDIVMAWRIRLGELLYGPNPPLTQATRAVIALGGLQDCTMQFMDEPRDELRAAAVDAAMSTLNLV
jgi:AcrR family transcriptional regulator